MKRMKNLLQRGGGGGDANDPQSPPPPRPSSQQHRQLWYGGLFLSSLIAMGSTFEAVRIQRYYSPVPITNSGQQRWAVGSITATFLLAFVMIILQMMSNSRHLLLGTKLEVGLILALVGFTCAAVGTSTNPATGMAINASGGISFGNLYYSTWASFGCGVALLLSFLRTERGVDVSSELESRGKRFRLWVILVVTSLVVMGSSASTYDAKCGSKDVDGFRPPKYCRRAAFGVSAGFIGCVFSLAVVAMRLGWTKRGETNGGEEGKSQRPNNIIFVVECISSLVLLCFYCFAVAYLTGEEGPGAPLGNLYYSTWITFGLIFFMAASCFEEYQAAKLVYARNQQGSGSGVSEGDGRSVTLSSHGRPFDLPIGLPVNENHVPVETNYQDLNRFRQMAPLIGNRSGSVGEVQI
mmetsp:Transcript_27059/g.51142  ORF Transcript_27059/g.51142 Transcript_27059/m.51142 type:complete len:409 (-) Transcript_27059:53-1279(-)